MRKPPGKPAYSPISLVAAGLFMMAGIAGFVFFLLSGINNAEKSLTRVLIPGEMQCVLEPGNYTLFHEYRSIYNGQAIICHNLPPLTVTVTNTESGETVPLEPASMRSTYKSGSYSGSSIMTFVIPKAGEYLFEARYHDTENNAATVLSFSHEFGEILFSTIFVSIAVLFAAICIPGLIIAIPIIKYIREKNRYDRAMAEHPAAFIGNHKKNNDDLDDEDIYKGDI